MYVIVCLTSAQHEPSPRPEPAQSGPTTTLYVPAGPCPLLQILDRDLAPRPSGSAIRPWWFQTTSPHDRLTLLSAQLRKSDSYSPGKSRGPLWLKIHSLPLMRIQTQSTPASRGCCKYLADEQKKQFLSCSVTASLRRTLRRRSQIFRSQHIHCNRAPQRRRKQNIMSAFTPRAANLNLAHKCKNLSLRISL